MWYTYMYRRNTKTVWLGIIRDETWLQIDVFYIKNIAIAVLLLPI